MSSLLWSLFEVLSDFWDQFFFLYLISRQLPEKRSSRFHNLATLFTFVGTLVVLHQLQLPYLISFTGMFLLHLAYCLLFRQGALWLRFLWPVVARFTFWILNQLVLSFISAIPGYDYSAMGSPTPQRFQGMCLYMFLSAIAFYLLAKIRLRSHALSRNAHIASIVMALLCVLFAGVIFDFAPLAMQQEASAWLLNTAIAGFMSSSLVWLFILERLAVRNAEISTLLLEHQRLESESAHAEDLHTAYEKMQVLSHDFKNFLFAVAGLAEVGDLQGIKDYLTRFQVEIKSGELLIWTGYSQLDAILSAKLRHADEMGINTDICIIPPEHLSADILDLCSILGNILDNALEAAQHLPEEQRFLRLHIGSASNMLQIHLANSSIGRYETDGNTLLSIKKDAWHGLGLKSVHKLVEKNGGFMHVYPDPDAFTVDIFFPVAGEKQPETPEVHHIVQSAIPGDTTRSQ